MLTLEENKNNNVPNDIQNQNQIQLSTTPLERIPNSAILPINPLSARLMNTKIVRIHPGSICACVTGYKKIIFNINTISRVDDRMPANENETPLFYVEEKLDCSCCGSCKPFEITFEIFDSLTKELFSTSTINQLDQRIDECCGEKYTIHAPICNFKASNPGDMSFVNRYDSRSFYRTYDHLGQSHYKIGWPYVKKEKKCCDDCKCSLYCVCSYIPIICCFVRCCKCEDERPINAPPKTNGGGCSCKDCCRGCCCCCCCCEEKKEGIVEEIIDKRLYINIFNMSDQSVGKFAYLFEKGCCCASDKLFYEIYFPPDANEMVRLALIAQIIFFYKFRLTGNKAFLSLPGNRENIEQFMN